MAIWESLGCFSGLLQRLLKFFCWLRMFLGRGKKWTSSLGPEHFLAKSVSRSYSSCSSEGEKLRLQQGVETPRWRLAPGNPRLAAVPGSLVTPPARSGAPGAAAGLLTWSRRSGTRRRRLSVSHGASGAPGPPYIAPGTCGRRSAPPRSAASRDTGARLCESCPLRRAQVRQQGAFCSPRRRVRFRWG